MRRVRLYVDGSVQSKYIERELRQRHIPYARMPVSPGRQPLPALETKNQVIAGYSNIRLYFLNGHEG